MVIIAIIVLIVLVIILYPSHSKQANPISYISPDASKKYTAPANWKGTPVDSKGRFINDEYPFKRNYRDILKWIPGHAQNLFRNRNLQFPVNHLYSSDILSENETLIWLGHASFFLRINNINILIDPHFYNAVIYKRHSDNPVQPALFRNIKYILLSHDHADHCDKRSLRLLINNNPLVTILSGLNMDTLVQSFTPQKVNAITAEWYEEFTIGDPIQISFVPSRHYCERLGEKFNCRLWGGFVIRYKHSSGENKTIYYGGDSGYGSHFKDIKQLFKPGLAILPIGSYMPWWFMEPNHMSPEEALQAFTDCGADQMLPMHYGTFNLSDEDMEEPIKGLLALKGKCNILQLRAGEILRLL